MEIANMSAVAVGTIIIIIGRECNNGLSGQSYMLDTTSPDPQWEAINVQLEESRFEHTANFIGNKLYVCGGFGGDRYLDSIETILITDLIPHDKLQMISLHVLCCDPHSTIDQVRSTIES